MIALTLKDVLAQEVVVPWSEPYQIRAGPAPLPRDARDLRGPVPLGPGGTDIWGNYGTNYNVSE